MWSYLQSWFLEIRGPISRAGSLKYVVLNPELVPVLVPCNTWSYLQSCFLGIHSNISRAAAGTRAGSLKYLVLSPKLVPAFSMVPSLEMVPWNTWSYLQSWYLPFPCFHLWRWFLEICGLISRAGTYLFRSSISATISGSGTSLFHGTLSGDGSLKYLVLSTELVPTFSMVPSLGMVPWNMWSYLCYHSWSWHIPFPWFHLWRWLLEMRGPVSRAGTRAVSLKYVVLSTEQVPWNTWSYCKSQNYLPYDYWLDA